MYGICPVCQTKQRVKISPIPRKKEKARGLTDDEIDMQYGGNINCMLFDHNSYDQHCEGSGQIPQATIPDIK